jgi:hypothetical protein
MSTNRREGELDPNKPTHVVVVLDESGSMGCVRDTTISGMNEFIQEQKKVKTGALFTLTKFNTTVTTIRDKENMATTLELSVDEYIPDGMTALYDAIGKNITKYRDDNTHDYVFVIFTDGAENSSKEYSKFAITEMIKQQQKKGWEFVYLGANQDAFQVGGALGIKHNVNYSYGNMKEEMATCAAAVNQYRCSKMAAGFSAHSAASKRSAPLGPQPSKVPQSSKQQQGWFSFM